MFKSILFVLVSCCCILPFSFQNCEKEQSPIGYFSLKKNKRPHQEISQIRAVVTVFQTQKTIKIASFRRRMYYKYCYDGGPGDPNTKCEAKTQEVPASIGEIQSFNKRGVCPIGYECAPYGDCWGSWANERCKSLEANNNKPGDSYLKWTQEDWTKFAYHTCIKSWECLIHESEVELYIPNVEEYQEGFNLPNGQFVSTTEPFFSDGFTDSDGFKHVPLNPHEKTAKWEEEMHCLSSAEAGVICQPLKGSVVPQVSILFPLEKTSTSLKNFKLTLQGKVPHIGAEGIEVYNVKTKSSYPYHVMDAFGFQKSTRVEDIITVINSMHYTQFQSIHNIFQLKGDVFAIYSFLTSLVEYLMQKDPWLLGGILEKDWYTRNIDFHVFETYLCQNLQTRMRGNCFGRFIYKHGALVEKTPEDVCEHYPENSVKNVSLFEENPIDTTLVKEGEIGVSAKDSSIWAWMVDFKYKSENAGGYEGKDSSWASSISSSISSLINPFASFHKYFTFVSSIMTWILMLIICIRR